PLCNGHIGLSGVYQALLEQSHRYAAAVTVLVLATFVAARRRAERDLLACRAAAAGVALIGAQVLLGAITVFAHNAGWPVALHLAGAGGRYRHGGEGPAPRRAQRCSGPCTELAPGQSTSFRGRGRGVPAVGER